MFRSFAFLSLCLLLPTTTWAQAAKPSSSSVFPQPSHTLRGEIWLSAPPMGSDTGRVELLPFVDNATWAAGALAGRLQPAPLQASPIGADGLFVLSAETGIYKLRVTVPGFVPMERGPVLLVEDTVLPPVTLGADVGGWVELTTEAGDAMARVPVQVAPSSAQGTRLLWSGSAADGWYPAPRLGLTDAQGRLDLPRLDGEWWHVSAHLPWNVKPYAVRDVESAKLVMKPAEPQWRRIRVVDEAGAPVAGALVAAGRPPWPIGRTDKAGELTFSARGARPVPLFITTGDGREVLLDVPLTDAIGAGEVRDVTLPRPLVLTGTLRLPSPVSQAPGSSPVPGPPAAGALVWTRHNPALFVRADSQGRFQWTGPAMRGMRLQADLRGHLPRFLKNQDLKSPDGVELEARSYVSGRVLDGAGRPVAQAQIVGRRPALPGAENRAPRAVARGLTDADGRFRLGLASGHTYRIQAEDARGRRDEATVAELAPSGLTGLEIRLPDGAGAIGRVARLDESPLAGAWVTVRPSGSGFRAPTRRAAPERPEDDPWTTLTDDEGRFHFAELPARRIDVVASAPGYAPFVVPGLEVAPSSDGGVVDLGLFALEEAARLAGLVVDEAGEPVPGAGLWIFDMEHLRLGFEPEMLRGKDPDGEVSNDGRFELSELQPRKAVDLIVVADGYLPARAEKLLPMKPTAAESTAAESTAAESTAAESTAAESTEPKDELRIVLRPASGIGGRVLDAAGRPVPEAVVHLLPPETRAGVRSETATDVGSRETVTDEQGHFAIDGVEPGSYQWRATAYGYRVTEPRPLRLAAQEQRRDLEWTLEPGVTVRGRVLDAAGAPVADAVVHAESSSALSDAEGAYELAGLTPGPGLLTAQHRLYRKVSQELEIVAEGGPVDFVFEGALHLRAQVTDVHGAPVEAVQLTLESLDGRDYRRLIEASDDDGEVLFDTVARGEYRLVAEKRGWVVEDVPPRIQVGDDGDGEPVSVVMQAGIVLKGHVLGLELDELADLKVQAERMHRPDEAPHRASVDYEGAFELRDLPPGEWILSATTADGSRRAREVTSLSVGDEEVEQDLEFEVGLALLGEVFHGEEPLAGATVQLLGLDLSEERFSRTGHGGDFRLEDLKPGRYRLTVSHRREQLIHNEELTLRSDDRVRVDIRTGRVAGVVTADGGAVQDAMVRLRRLVDGESGASKASVFSVATDEAGRFEMARLTAGRYEVTVRKDGFAEVDDALEVPAGGDLSGLSYALERSLGLDLQVRTVSGRVPPQVDLVLLGPNGQAVLRESRAVDGSGLARFPTVQAGEWTAVVSAPGAAARRLQVRAGGDGSDGEVGPIQVLLDDAGRLKVRVAELTRPHEVAEARLVGADGTVLEGIDPHTNDLTSTWRLVAGRGLIDGVPAGPWTVQVTTVDGRAWQTETTAVADGQVDVIVR